MSKNQFLYHLDELENVIKSVKTHHKDTPKKVLIRYVKVEMQNEINGMLAALNDM